MSIINVHQNIQTLHCFGWTSKTIARISIQYIQCRIETQISCTSPRKIHASVRFLYIFVNENIKCNNSQTSFQFTSTTLYTSICFSQSLAIILQSLLYNIKQNSIFLFHSYTHITGSMRCVRESQRRVMFCMCIDIVSRFILKYYWTWQVGSILNHTLLLYFTIRDVTRFIIMSFMDYPYCWFVAALYIHIHCVYIYVDRNYSLCFSIPN